MAGAENFFDFFFFFTEFWLNYCGVESASLTERQWQSRTLQRTIRVKEFNMNKVGWIKPQRLCVTQAVFKDITRERSCSSTGYCNLWHLQQWSRCAMVKMGKEKLRLELRIRDTSLEANSGGYETVLKTEG